MDDILAQTSELLVNAVADVFEYGRGLVSSVFASDLAFGDAVNRACRAVLNHPHFDLYAVQAAQSRFCERHLLPAGTRFNLSLFVEEISVLLRPYLWSGDTFEFVTEFSETTRELSVNIELP